jgi:putative hydrolase of the HAD superfamily
LRFPAQQTLMIDADDTLWENNIYFEQAIASFISYLDHRVHSPEEVRSHLNRIEHETVQARGYGLKSFHHSLVTCFEELSDGPLTDEKRARIQDFAHSIEQTEIELLPDVASTLADLHTRHRLILVTKGDTVEQKNKLSLSGLAPYFYGVEVLAEKHREAYTALVPRYGSDPAKTWMIGNSPRSDINPALAAGLNAVFIPHHATWVLEHESVNEAPSGQRFLELSSFKHLSAHF